MRKAEWTERGYIRRVEEKIYLAGFLSKLLLISL